MIELRSDTFTLPTREMLDAAASAELGDDVWGEDPTVSALEQKGAALMGKEAGLFVSSGTQGNLIGILSHTNRAEEVIVGDRTHIFNAEVASAAAVGGVQLRTVPNTPRGTFDMDRLQTAIRPDDVHFPRTALICVENSHNMCNGAVLDLHDMADVREVASEAGAFVHLDGARIFNAAIALDIPAAELARDADSVSFCLSKGLSAPVGSVLCGPSEYINRARRYRKMLGGGMRQAGVLAAPGIVALDTMVNRLADDHVNARRLGEALASIPGIVVDLETLRTNIVFANFGDTGKTSSEVVDGLAERGIKAAAVGPTRMRLLTHRGVSASDIDQAIEALRDVFAESKVAVGT